MKYKQGLLFLIFGKWFICKFISRMNSVHAWIWWSLFYNFIKCIYNSRNFYFGRVRGTKILNFISFLHIFCKLFVCLFVFVLTGIFGRVPHDKIRNAFPPRNCCILDLISFVSRLQSLINMELPIYRQISPNVSININIVVLQEDI